MPLGGPKGRPETAPAPEGALRFDHLGAGDVVVEAAAVVAENEAVVGEREEEAEIGDGADKGRDDGAEEENFYEAGVRFVVEAHDADAEDAFTDGLAAGDEHPQLHAEEGEHRDDHDHEAGAEAGGGGEFFEVAAQAESGAGRSERDHDESGQGEGSADDIVEDLGEEAFAAARENGGGGDGVRERLGGGVVGRGAGEGRGEGFARAEFHVVAQSAPFF